MSHTHVIQYFTTEINTKNRIGELHPLNYTVNYQYSISLKFFIAGIAYR